MDRKDYELRVRPGEEVIRRLIGVKESTGECSQVNHWEIRLAFFCAGPDLEPTMLRWMQRILAGEAGFQVQLNSSGESSGSAVCLRLSESAALQELKDHLSPIDDLIRQNGFGPLVFERRPGVRLELPVYGIRKVALHSETGLSDGHFQVRELWLYSRGSVGEEFRKCAVLPLNPVISLTPLAAVAS